MKKTMMCLLMGVCLTFSFLSTSYALSVNHNPTPDELSNMEKVAKQVFTKSTTVSPSDAFTAIEYLYAVGKGLIEMDPKIATKLKIEDGAMLTGGEVAKAALDKVVDAGIDVIAENVEKKSGVDKYQTELLLKSFKNAGEGIIEGPVAGISGEIIDTVSIVKDSWQETAQAVANLPSNVPMDDSLRMYHDLLSYVNNMWAENNYLDFIEGVIGTTGFAVIDGTKVSLKYLWDLYKESFIQNAFFLRNPINQVNDIPPQMTLVTISVNRNADTLTQTFNFNKPMSQFVPGLVNQSGFCGPAGCTGNFSNFVWSNNGKTAKTTFTPSSGSYVSPPGNTFNWSTTNTTFIDTQGKFAPPASGYIRIP
ncbi:MAG: hypothetical protein HQL09_09610 [Nitrospirae bacterium]|nr:hypothetical protein [Nitrospirota bacterium]